MTDDFGVRVEEIAKEDRDRRAAKLERLFSAWRAVAATDSGHLVLKDLFDFIRPEDPTYHPELVRMAGNEGRREVWLHILKRLDQARSAAAETIRTMETLP